jgi:hypothetical protein
LDVASDEDISAQFSGRVVGADAVNDNEFVTKGQIDSLATTSRYTPLCTSDPAGTTGDMTWDDDYLYLKTGEGWKRAVLETWYASAD